MALALVPQARGRGEKSAKAGKKITTFDPILEGTRGNIHGPRSSARDQLARPSGPRSTVPALQGLKNGPAAGSSLPGRCNHGEKKRPNNHGRRAGRF